MNINEVINIINKEYGYNISSSYYAQIEEWRQWWEGYVKSFHSYREMHGNGSFRNQDIFSMRMAKKVCEDWASVLLNEKTKISVDDKSTSEFLQGPNVNGGLFAEIDFWKESNSLVEKAFYSGTGAFVLQLERAGNNEGRIVGMTDTSIRLDFLPASKIIPITKNHCKIIEAAFVSEDTIRGNEYIHIETHTLENGVYVIRNRYYEAITMRPVKPPDGVADEFMTGSPIPLFSILKPNVVNHYRDNLGLGCSIFANAIDNLKGLDLAFNNFCCDFKLGGKKVFYNRDIARQVGVKESGTPIYITPDEMMQQLFVSIGDEFSDGKEIIHEFNPSLRVLENKEGVQTQLDYLSFKCGFGPKHYRLGENGAAVTATQYSGDRQELRQNTAKHALIVEKALQDITRAILWAGKNILGKPINPDALINVEFSDGYIISDEEKMANDRQDIDRGIMQAWEYRVRWYNEDEATAKAMTQTQGPVYGAREFQQGEDG